MEMTATYTTALRLAGRDNNGHLNAPALAARTTSCPDSQELLSIAGQIDLAYALTPGGHPQLLTAAATRLRHLADTTDTTTLLGAGWLIDLCETGELLATLQAHAPTAPSNP